MIFVIASFFLMLCCLKESKIIFILSYILVAGYFSSNFAFGYDWINYYSTYQDIIYKDGFNFFSEPGYYFMMKLFSSLDLSFTSLYFFTSLMIYSFCFYFCNSLKLKSLAFFTLFSFMGFYIFNEGIRQGFAISMLLVAIVFLLKNNNKVFYSILVVACLFHVSAIIGLLYPLFLRSNYGKIKKYVLFIILIFSMLIFTIYNSSLFVWVPGIGDKLAVYSSSFIPDGGIINYLIQGRIMMVYLILLAFVYIKVKRNQLVPQLSVAFLALLVLILTRISVVLIRLGYFMVPLLTIGMDSYFSNKAMGLKTPISKIFYLLVIFILSTTFVIFNDMYKNGAESHLNLLSTDSDIKAEIIQKCNILNKQGANTVINKCFYNNYDL